MEDRVTNKYLSRDKSRENDSLAETSNDEFHWLQKSLRLYSPSFTVVDHEEVRDARWHHHDYSKPIWRRTKFSQMELCYRRMVQDWSKTRMHTVAFTVCRGYVLDHENNTVWSDLDAGLEWIHSSQLCDLDYADDIILLDTSDETMQKMTTAVETEVESWGCIWLLTSVR